MMRKVWRSVKLRFRKRRKEFVVDTIATTVFWLVVHGLKDVFVVQMTLTQVAVAAVTGVVLNLSLGGVYGQFLNKVRKWTKCRKQ